MIKCRVQAMQRVLVAIGPVRMAFIASLLLSYLSIRHGLTNRDGILYLDTAYAIIEQGITKIGGGFNWPFLPALIAGLGTVTGLDLETVAHTLNALLMAGTCGLLVAITRQRHPAAMWLACLVVLAIPGYNQYRSQILREYGFWFFAILSLWLAMRWEDAPKWKEAIFCQLTIGMAVLFRLEAVAIYPALMAWQLFSAPPGTKLRRAFMMGSIPLTGAFVLLLIYSLGLAKLPERVGYYIEAANPVNKVEVFKEAGRRLQDAGVFKYKYSREEAGYVLFFGLLSIIPMKFLKMCGVLIVPLLFFFSAQPIKVALARWQALAWMFLSYVLVLVVFVTHEFFLTGRYVSMLNLLSVPIVAVGLAKMIDRFPRWGLVFAALALITMAANVISTTPRKTQIVDAGKWLASNVTDSSRVYVNNPRIAYYAGWHSMNRRWNLRMDLASLDKSAASRQFDYIALEIDNNDEEIKSWLVKSQFHVVAKFAGKDISVVILGEKSGSKAD